jgi:hypothetical protein
MANLSSPEGRAVTENNVVGLYCIENYTVSARLAPKDFRGLVC